MRGLTIEKDSIVMSPDGRLRVRYGSRTGESRNSFEQKREELALKRKKLVFGLDGYEEHSLTEANRIVDDELDEYLDGRRRDDSWLIRYIRNPRKEIRRQLRRLLPF